MLALQLGPLHDTSVVPIVTALSASHFLEPETSASLGSGKTPRLEILCGTIIVQAASSQSNRSKRAIHTKK